MPRTFIEGRKKRMYFMDDHLTIPYVNKCHMQAFIQSNKSIRFSTEINSFTLQLTLARNISTFTLITSQ